MISRIAAALGFLALTCLALLFAVVRPSFTKDPNPVQVVIPKGYSARQIAGLLREKGAVRSPGFFLLLGKISGTSKEFRQGSYLLERNHYADIVHKIAGGLTSRIKVTIPEGWTAFQTAERLEKNGIIADKEPFLAWVVQNRLEGMLFPETYFFEAPTEPKAVADEMVARFRLMVSSGQAVRARELKMTESQILTLASIIEREAQDGSERPVISSVYHNRLKRRMPLEADPTVQYAVGEGKFWKEKLTYADLNVKSPYNTYRRSGLPPGPICSPGAKSIDAALYPDQTRYFYFLADGSGTHFFFENLKDHLRKKLELRRLRRAAVQKSH